jgi:hypothetical protein
LCNWRGLWQVPFRESSAAARESLAGFVRIAFSSEHAWLDTDDLIQLGLADALDSQWYPVDVVKNLGGSVSGRL